MKFTLSWLKEHLDTSATLQQIVEKLTLIGLEVEEVVNPAETLKAFKTAKVISAEKHPDADRLQVCMVDTGAQKIQVVCGAPNARAGMVGVFAPTGTFVPGIGIELKKGVIRGVESHGMLCSERELELSEEHDGIIDLPPHTEIGINAVDALGLNDPMIEIGITPNRPDCLGVYGIARDLAAAGLGDLKESRPLQIPGAFENPIDVAVDFPSDKKHVCPAFGAVYVRGVKNAPSPDWMQRRLIAIGLRPINALVDITNYVSYDRGRPLHVYDADKIQGRLHARLGKTGESLNALDGKDYDVDDTMCVIADDSGPVGLGGIMGGTLTGSQPETVNVLIESAYFDPIATAETGRKTGILSDARYRFERGVDPDYVMAGLALATQLVMDLCGGEPSHSTLAGAIPERNLVVNFPWSEVKRLTGLTNSTAEIKLTLKSLGFHISGPGMDMDDIVRVAPPTWRPDIHGKADLVEEVVRIIGLDQVISTPLVPDVNAPPAKLSESQKRVRGSRRVLANRGMVEVINWSFISQLQAQTFGGGQSDLKLANPMSVEMSYMRPSLLPGLITAAQRNADRSQPDLALFEVAQIYLGSSDQDQRFVASGVRRGTLGVDGGGRHWSGKTEPVDVFDAKADVLAVLADMGVNIDNVQISADAPSWYHPGRSGRIMLGPKVCLGHFGVIHPMTLENLGAKGPIIGFEVFLDAIPKGRKKTTSKSALEASQFQPVQRDFAFLLKSDVSAAVLLRAAKGAEKNLITEVNIFDVFEGGTLDQDTKSVAIQVTLQPKVKTLTDDEIEAVSAKIIAAVSKSTGGSLRS